MVSSENIVDVVDSSRSESDLGEVSWPNTSIHVLGVILREIVRVDVVVDVSGPLFPLLEVVLFEVVVAWTDGEDVEHFLH